MGQCGSRRGSISPPLAGYTNLPFRLSVREVGGVGLCTTDLVNARAILQGIAKTMELLATDPAERPLFVQIFGSERRGDDRGREVACRARTGRRHRHQHGLPGSQGRADRRRLGDDVRHHRRTVDLVRKVVESVPVPVSVKMRLGWDDDNLTAPFFAREFEKVGVAAITIHGRTREQGFSAG